MARRCLDTGEPRGAFGLDGASAGEGMKFCLVHVLSDATGPRAAIAVVTRCKDREDVSRRLSVLCGAG